MNKVKDVVVVYTDGTKELQHSKDLSDAGQDNYYGWECTAGQSIISIYPEGDIYRGVCKNGESLGNLNSEFEIPITPTICTYTRCSCVTDVASTDKKRI